MEWRSGEYTKGDVTKKLILWTHMISAMSIKRKRIIKLGVGLLKLCGDKPKYDFHFKPLERKYF